jgi:transcriptional regulator with XRE-family HTH domain
MGLRSGKKSAESPQIVFGRVLREIRAGRGLSQEALGHESGYHRTYIGMLERGEYSPSLEALFLLGRALGALPSELLASVESVLRLGTRESAVHRRARHHRRVSRHSPA